jgi:hypothetical protein
MPPIQIALVRYHDEVPIDEFFTVAAALQTQATRDVAPIWGVQAVISPFLKLEHVPPGYFPLVVVDAVRGGHDYHVPEQGLPMAVVQFLPGTAWSVLASHEMIEMIVDPGGNLTASAWVPDVGWRQYIVEVCDPCQDVFYLIGNVAVSDFVTPDYYDPSTTRDVRYSFTGALRAPLMLTADGYVSYMTSDGSVQQASGAPTENGDRVLEANPGIPLRASTGEQTNVSPLVLARIAERGTEEAQKSGRKYGETLSEQVRQFIADSRSAPSGEDAEAFPPARLPTEEQRIIALLEQLSNPAYTTYRDFQEDPERIYDLFRLRPPKNPETRARITKQLASPSHFAEVVRTTRTGRLLGDPGYMDYINTHSSFHGWP